MYTLWDRKRRMYVRPIPQRWVNQDLYFRSRLEWSRILSSQEGYSRVGAPVAWSFEFSSVPLLIVHSEEEAHMVAERVFGTPSAGDAGWDILPLQS